jgi:hypothetical protein
MRSPNSVLLNLSALLLLFTFFGVSSFADEPATISQKGNSWTLQNETLISVVKFTDGKLMLSDLYNREANCDYLKATAPASLFKYIIQGKTLTADDGGWTLVSSKVDEITGYGSEWGKQLEIVLSRTQPVAFSVRQIFEIYKDRGGLRIFSFVRNNSDKNLTISSSDVVNLNLPDRPHTLYYIDGVLDWKSTNNGLTNGGRNGIIQYSSGDGWYILPENNWATSLEPGASKAHSSEKLLGIFIWNSDKTVRVATNPKAVQLTLFTGEELEYFSVNIGLFKGDVADGRMAVAEHLRLRYRYHDPSRILSTNDWQWGGVGGKRTDSVYRNILIPKARAAGFDRIHIDDFWYEPEDGVTPKGNWTNMPDLCNLIKANGMIPGHWFSLQGKICIHGWGNGRDCADPANIDFKLKQLEDTLIGQYSTGWDQVDAGLLWKTAEASSYSNPESSVYRKILGMRKYMNTITHKYPDFIMQTTCEVDNPAGPGAGDSHGNQNIGLIHLPNNGIAGMYRRTEFGDDVRDLFADIGMFPLEGMLSTWGEDGNIRAAWKDSPLWYYQFLLARHTSIYSWPGDWSTGSLTHLRTFNDWRKSAEIEPILNEIMRPVYNGPDWMKNEGPWSWMYVNKTKSRALLFAINHLDLAPSNSFSAKLRWLDEKKTYTIEEITQLPDGSMKHEARGEFRGAQLKSEGFPINLDQGPEHCAAFLIQEKATNGTQKVSTDKSFEYQAAKAIYKNNQLVVSTGKIERTWVWTGMGFQTISLKNQQTGTEYGQIKGKYKCDWDLPGAISDSCRGMLVDIAMAENDDAGFTNKHLQVVATIKYPDAKLLVQYVIWAFPDAPGIRTQLRIKALDNFSPKGLPDGEGKRMDCGHWIAVPSARAEFLPLNFTQQNSRRYWGYYNNPGSRHDPSREMLEETVVSGYPLFLTEDNNWASGLSVEYNNGLDGVAIVKESPKCVNQQAHYTGSFYSGQDGLAVTGWGLTPEEIIPDHYRDCWATWTIIWSQGNDGMQLALKQFDRARYPAYAERDLFILSNTWGPANPGGAQFTDEKFLMKEIPALSKLGIDVMQIDDGWQKSGGGPDAQSFSPKYKNGWKDLKSEADKYGLKFGLWVTAKYSTAAELKKNIDELGFISWKVDFDQLVNRSDYEARIAKYREVMKYAWMKTQFTLCPEYDDPRYGWYFCKEYGSIYFQNIQESLPAHLTMVPYQVLRQHWLMAKYFNTNKLQIMLQNPKRTNPDRSDAPQHSHSYCFAMGVPFIPCFFQSAQYLDDPGQKELKDFIARYKNHREAIFNCFTFPIGDKPDNQSWSGFQMINGKDRTGNYLLLFRELHNLQATKAIRLKLTPGATLKFTNIETGKNWTATATDDGLVNFEMKDPGSYLFLKYEIL